MGREILSANGTVSAGATTTVVAAVTDKVIHITKMITSISAAGSMQLKKTAGNAITPAFAMGQYSPWVMRDFDKLESAPGAGLDIVAVGGDVAYYIEYVLEP